MKFLLSSMLVFLSGSFLSASAQEVRKPTFDEINSTLSDQQIEQAVGSLGSSWAIFSTVSDAKESCSDMQACLSALAEVDRQVAEVQEKFNASASIEEKQALLNGDFWVGQMRLRALAKFLCDYGKDQHCVIYSERLIQAANDSYNTEFNTPSVEQLVDETEQITKQSCEESQPALCILRAVHAHREIACNRSSAEACLLIAGRWNEVLSLKLEEPPIIEAYLTRACDLNAAKGCWAIAQRMVENEQGWSQESVDLASKSCGLGEMQACLNIAQSRKKGLGGMEADPDDAMSFLTGTYCKALEFSEVQCDMKFKEL